jgi:hypothetical protein
MPMGAKNGNAAFQRMMDWILKDLDCADPFVDDVIVFSTGDTEEELIHNHMKDLCTVLNRLREHQLVCDKSKAQMFQREVEFCGQLIGHGMRRPAPGKLSCLEKWQRPKSVSELRSFLGFCNWYHDYVEMYAEVAAPLMSLLKVPAGDGKKGSKVKLNWTPEAERAFEQVKQKLLEKLELQLIDPDAPFILRCDASEYAVGAALEQPTTDGSTKPVGFWSRKLTSGQTKTWSPREKETYAIVEALRKWAGSIGCQPVVVLTDHQALQSWYQEKVDTPSGPAGRRGRWHELLSKFDLEVHYIPGSQNTVADALSRWAYPASKGLQDCSRHGSKADAQEVEDMEHHDEQTHHQPPPPEVTVESLTAEQVSQLRVFGIQRRSSTPSATQLQQMKPLTSVHDDHLTAVTQDVFGHHDDQNVHQIHSTADSAVPTSTSAVTRRQQQGQVPKPKAAAAQNPLHNL